MAAVTAPKDEQSQSLQFATLADAHPGDETRTGPAASSANIEQAPAPTNEQAVTEAPALAGAAPENSATEVIQQISSPALLEPEVLTLVDPSVEYPQLTGNVAPTEAITPVERAEATDVKQHETRMPSILQTALQVPETLAAVAAPASPRIEKKVTVPGYEILGVLGQGGMGVVYKARHIRLNRIVALKMMLSGAHGSMEESNRFRSEAEAVASLKHPNVVQIYEIGEHEGMPFFSLEFVEGGSLAEKLNGAPQPPRQAAELSEKLARAMFVAHQAGIIHRDLKPANILLQSDGEPKITDFGLAKHLDTQSGQTRTGAVMGTPSYMAPEQAAGKTKELGPPADIYALGAILYDVLTGRPPFKGETVLATLLLVQSMEPLSPMRLQPSVPADLETICLKCLQKEPNKRYPTAQDLADDLRRFLEGRPIAARPIAAPERIIKWARRHPSTAALVAVSIGALLALGLGGLVFAQHERHRAEEAVTLRKQAEENARSAFEQEHLAQENEARANLERQRAEVNFKHARAAVDEMLTRVSQDDLAREPRMEKVRRDLLQKALRFYQRFVQEKSDDPQVRWETGRAQQRIGDIQEMLGQHDPAVRAYQAALAILGQLAAEYQQRPDFRQDLSVVHNNLGIVLQAAGQKDRAEEAYRRSLAEKEKLVADFPEVPAYRRELASSYNNRGILLQTRNQFHDAENAYRQAIALFTKLTSEVPDSTDYQQELARTYANLGVLLQINHRSPQAEDAYRQAVAVQSHLVALLPNVPEFQKEHGRSLFNLGVLLQLNGAPQKAEDVYRQAISIFMRLSSEFPSVPEYRHELAVSNNNLGNLYQDLRRPKAAEECWNQARALLTKLVEEVHGVPIYRQELARNHNELGIYLASTGNAQEAEAHWRQALALQSALVIEFPQEPAYRQELARSHGNLGILMAQRNQLDRAEEHYRKALDTLDDLATKFPAVAGYVEEWSVNQSNLANLLTAVGRTQEAEKCWRAMIARQEKLVGDFPKVASYERDLARTQGILAQNLVDRAQFGQARELLRSAVSHQAHIVSSVAPDRVSLEFLCSYHLSLAETEIALEDHAAASTTVTALLTVAPALWQKYHRAACVLATCARLADQDAKLSPEQRRQWSRAYGGQAVVVLRKAIANGYKDASFLKSNPGLDTLRSRDDFKELVGRLDESKAAKNR